MGHVAILSSCKTKLRGCGVVQNSKKHIVICYDEDGEDAFIRIGSIADE
jgi:hypothetical protein